MAEEVGSGVNGQGNGVGMFANQVDFDMKWLFL